MQKRLLIIGIVLTLAVAGAGGIVFYYHYQNEHYVITEDARIAADMVTITPEISGKILEWNIKEGDTVQAGQVIGRQDLSSVLTSSSVNPQTMKAMAGVMAEKATLKAPISGLVVQSKAVVGQMATPGMPLAVIADIENLYISANIKEVTISKVKVGQPVEVKIDAYLGRVLSGRVENIGTATTSVFSLLPAQNSNGNYIKVTQVIPVKIRIVSRHNLKLMPGMNVTVKIHVDEASSS
ncbi:MAG: Secretion protein HlyD [Thermoanaerobacterales bacterium 50_218]|nr:MAG: Secretion protein HlyD [Thermoanaerobacterales bacterium 50_218]